MSDMDTLLRRIDGMNELVKLTSPIQGWFSYAQREVCIWGLIEITGKDVLVGLVPDFGCLRPLSANNPTWVRLWPDLEV
jgi:hypothetical protein